MLHIIKVCAYESALGHLSKRYEQHFFVCASTNKLWDKRITWVNVLWILIFFLWIINESALYKQTVACWGIYFCVLYIMWGRKQADKWPFQWPTRRAGGIQYRTQTPGAAKHKGFCLRQRNKKHRGCRVQRQASLWLGMHLKDSLRLGKEQIQYFFHEKETLLQGSFKAQSWWQEDYSIQTKRTEWRAVTWPRNPRSRFPVIKICTAIPLSKFFSCIK